MEPHDLARSFLNREGVFYLLLEQQAKLVHDAAKALLAFSVSDADLPIVTRVVDQVEKESDQVACEIQARLAQVLVTPIDREDIQLLSSELEGIIDAIHDGTHSSELVGIARPTRPMTLLLEHLEEATSVLEEGVAKLRVHDYRHLRLARRRMCEVNERADEVYRAALHRMYHDSEIDIRRLLIEREVLDDYERAITRCERTGSLLAHIAVKHG